jgi:uncharacterized protein YoxC
MADTDIAEAGSSGGGELELKAPQNEALSLAGRIGEAVEAVHKRLRLANEVTLDADQLTGWFVKKKRFRVQEGAAALRAEAEADLKEISDKTVAYASSSREAGKELERALAAAALSGAGESPGADPRRLSRDAVRALDKISREISAFWESYPQARQGEAPAPREGGAEGADAAEPGEDGAPFGGSAPEGGEGEAGEGAPEPPELQGSPEQTLELLSHALAAVQAKSSDRFEETEGLLKQVEKHHSPVYLERKKLTAQVSDTVDGLERSLTENRIHSGRIERSVGDLSAKVSQTLDRMRGEFEGSVRGLEGRSEERLRDLRGQVDSHKAECLEKLSALSSDFAGIREKLDSHAKSFGELSENLSGLTQKLGELEARSGETAEKLQQGIDELRAELAAPPAPILAEGAPGVPARAVYAWGAIVSVVAVIALIVAIAGH